MAVPQLIKFGHKCAKSCTAIAKDLRPGGCAALLLHLTTHLLESIEFGLCNILGFLRLQHALVSRVALQCLTACFCNSAPTKTKNRLHTAASTNFWYVKRTPKDCTRKPASFFSRSRRLGVTRPCSGLALAFLPPCFPAASFIASSRTSRAAVTRFGQRRCLPYRGALRETPFRKQTAHHHRRNCDSMARWCSKLQLEFSTKIQNSSRQARLQKP